MTLLSLAPAGLIGGAWLLRQGLRAHRDRLALRARIIMLCAIDQTARPVAAEP
jgi:hypothetical protein